MTSCVIGREHGRPREPAAAHQLTQRSSIRRPQETDIRSTDLRSLRYWGSRGLIFNGSELTRVNAARTYPLFGYFYLIHGALRPRFIIRLEKYE